MLKQRTSVRVRNKFIGAGKISSLTEQGRIIKGKVKLRFGAINYNGLTGGIAILKTERGIKNDSILVKINIRRMSLKPKDF